MNHLLKMPLAIGILLITAHRLPAPIVEEEKTTRAPTTAQSEAPERKHHFARSTSAEKSPAQTETKTKAVPAPSSQGPTRFAGTWTGVANVGMYGQINFTLVVDPTGGFVEESSSTFGTHRCAAQREGNTLKWKSGDWYQAGFHTLTPNLDGRNAIVTCGNGMLMKTTSTFIKVNQRQPKSNE
jgi:hypothetical protein